ncbi:MAG: N-acetylglucosamine-6-phosphate deacetylase [Actinomycetota bacterium]
MTDPNTMLLRNGRVLTPGGIAVADLVVNDGRITAIAPGAAAGDGATVIDAGDLLVVPGYIDIQINGGFGHDFTQNPETIWDVGARLPEYGVTAFFPTVITSPPETFVEAQRVMTDGPPEGYAGAVPIGLHLEGPMLSPKQPGTHDTLYLREPAEVATDTWGPETGVRMVTLAPELPGALDLITALAERGIVVSIGHSNATYDEAVAGFRAGATVGTHLYNAMSALHHREPGLVGALLAEPEVAAEIIVDGIHSHPKAVRIAWDAKGPDNLVLITDAMAAMGMGHGEFVISSINVFVDETGPRNASGVLAGSALTMDEAVRNLAEFAGCSAEEAIGAATANPAAAISDAERGVLEAGARADITLLDQGLGVVATMVGGAVVHGASEVSIDTTGGSHRASKETDKGGRE